MNSKFLSLNWMDLLKGLLIAVIGAMLTGIYQGIHARTLTFTWTFFQPIVLTGIDAAFAYLLKNFLSNSQGEPLRTEK